jgi:hypothetical protein
LTTPNILPSFLFPKKCFDEGRVLVSFAVFGGDSDGGRLNKQQKQSEKCFFLLPLQPCFFILYLVVADDSNRMQDEAIVVVFSWGDCDIPVDQHARRLR